VGALVTASPTGATPHTHSTQHAAKEKAQRDSFPEQNPNPVIEIDHTGRVLYANPAGKRLFPDLDTPETEHPWLPDIDGVIDTLAQHDTPSLVREIAHGDRWYRQEFVINPASGHLRVYGHEITDRVRATQALEALNTDLEARVACRTTELRAAEEVVRRTNAYNRSLLEAALDPLMTLGRDGRITDVNRATETVTGYAREALIGTDFADYFTEPDHARAGYEQVFREGVVQDYPLEIRHRDGHLTPVLYNATVYYDEAGEVDGVFAAARDVSEQRRVEAALRAQTIILEEANKELDAFTFSVSHDLRAPLRAIDGYAHMLAEDYAPLLDAEGRRFLDVISDNAKRMGTLIDDLLGLSRLGRKALVREIVHPDDLARAELRELAPEMAGRIVNVEIEKLPPCLADPGLLRQVHQNLLANALKFTRTRHPAQITVGATQTDGHTVYYVRDNGVGFDMQYVDKLFGVFQRLHRMEDYEGTGIGLAVVHRIVQRHGGRVWAEGVVDEGATFYFTLDGGTTDDEHRRDSAGGGQSE
jgi:PAS domain S-box-containing protein